jgi:hypothetical protein
LKVTVPVGVAVGGGGFGGGCCGGFGTGGGGAGFGAAGFGGAGGAPSVNDVTVADRRLIDAVPLSMAKTPEGPPEKSAHSRQFRPLSAGFVFEIVPT